MKAGARHLASGLLLAAGLCTSRPSSATEQIFLAGDDLDLVRRLTDELRASGYTVAAHDHARDAAPEDAATVIVTTAATHIHIQVMVHGHLDQHTISVEAESSGMTPLAQASLHAAEAVRSMVETEGPETAVSPLLPRLESSEENRPSALSLPVPIPGPHVSPPSTTPPRARLAVTAGLVYSRPLWTLAQSFTTRGQVLPRLSLGGALGLAMAADTEPIDGHLVETLGGTGQLFVEWEPLGTIETWTPALGAGLRGEYTYYIHELANEPAASPDDGQLFGLAPLLRLGASFLRPVRVRVDGTIGFRALSIDVAGTHANAIAPRLAPTFGLMVGLAFDVGTDHDEPLIAGRPHQQF